MISGCPPSCVTSSSSSQVVRGGKEKTVFKELPSKLHGTALWKCRAAKRIAGESEAAPALRPALRHWSGAHIPGFRTVV